MAGPRNSFKIAINGLDELRAALRQLPEDLAREADVIVAMHAKAAASEMDQAYARHDVSGNLRRGLSVRQDMGGRWATRWIVRNRAPHAYIAEHGTENVRRTLGRGKKKKYRAGIGRGRMPPLNIFIPIAQRKRRLMVEALAGVVRRHGLRISGATVSSEAA